MTPTVIATRSDRIQRILEHLRQQSTDTVAQLVPFGPGQYTDPGLAQRERELRALIQHFVGDAALLGFTLAELITQLRNEEKK